MSSLFIDFKLLFPYAIEAYTAVLGEEYHEMISQKINSIVIIQYHDVEGIRDYIRFLSYCKYKEFAVRFLKEIGAPISNDQNINYTEPLDENIQKYIFFLLGDSFSVFSKNISSDIPLKAFDSTDPKLLNSKIKIINLLLGFKDEEITKDNFEAFSETEEYKELLKKINNCNTIYERLASEYQEWESVLQPAKEYIASENKRREKILQKKKIELFKEIIPRMPEAVINAISNKPLEEQADIILSKMDISTTLPTEFFGKEKMDRLKSSKVNSTNKYLIIRIQLKYLRELGVTIPDNLIDEDEFKVDFPKYLAFLNEEHVKKYIPSEEVINSISASQEKKHEEYIEEYYTTREDCLNAIQRFGNKETIYKTIKNKRVCVSPAYTEDPSKVFPLMFFTIRPDDGGALFHIFMHEVGHSIDLNSRCGFDNCNNVDGLNPYDKAYRKYERFNEILNDIFTIEAVEYLQNKEIYLIEAKEFTTRDQSNSNTYSITKDLLKPLLQKFRKQVIRAKVTSKPDELIKYIGNENFENLVDAINKIDHLLNTGVLIKIKSSEDDPIVQEYFEEIERIKQIYISIDDYYNNNFGSISEVESKPKL